MKNDGKEDEMREKVDVILQRKERYKEEKEKENAKVNRGRISEKKDRKY